MIYLVTKNPKKQRCFLEEVKDFEELVDMLELTPFYYEIFATMKEDEAKAKYDEWRMKFYDCSPKI